MKSEDSVQKRVVPEITISSTDAPTIEQLNTELKKRWEHIPQAIKVRAWQAEGITLIHDNVEWLSAQIAVGMYEWMDGTLKVLVEI